MTGSCNNMFVWIQTISLKLSTSRIPDTSLSRRHGKLHWPVYTDKKSGTETYLICDRSDFKIGVAHMTVDMCKRKSYPVLCRSTSAGIKIVV